MTREVTFALACLIFAGCASLPTLESFPDLAKRKHRHFNASMSEPGKSSDSLRESSALAAVMSDVLLPPGDSPAISEGSFLRIQEEKVVADSVAVSGADAASFVETQATSDRSSATMTTSSAMSEDGKESDAVAKQVFLTVSEQDAVSMSDSASALERALPSMLESYSASDFASTLVVRATCGGVYDSLSTSDAVMAMTP